MAMQQRNRIGIDKAAAADLARQLNHLLAQYQIFYMNVRGFHWNIRGEKFFELHGQFELLYNDLQVKVDEVAERILTLGDAPIHTYAAYLEVAEIPVAQNITNWRQAVENILAAFQQVILLQRQLLKTSAESDDEGTNALMSDYIRQQEKSVWMYAALLEN
jgi:starvation-inducible DNA-binding protein